MKNPTPGMWVTHYGRRGVIEAVNAGAAAYAVVRFPASDGFPFPVRTYVRASELKKYKGNKQSVDDYEPALF
jgi:hypothetical protein